MHPDTQPVLIGVGQQTWRNRNGEHSPVDALQAVASMALSDTGSERVLPAVDAVVHVPFLLNQIPEMAAAMPANPGAVLAERLGIQARQYTADVGGNLPQQLVNAFAGRLVRGECRAVMICGAELLATFLGSTRSGSALPDWSTGRSDQAESVSATPEMSTDSEKWHGLFEPINAYPLFESALRHANALGGEEHGRLLGGIISRMSDVAAGNGLAWKRDRLSAEQVLSTDGGNRMISHPYTKVMNSVIAVDQAACVVLTTAGTARELGVDPERWVYLRGAAAARDTLYLSQRPTLHECPALAAAAAAALSQSGFMIDEIAHFDLYSCFPSAVQMACSALGIAVDDPRGLTVTGGMALFGGPGNNYSLHAIAEMVQRLRQDGSGPGLVTANGGYMTKHAVGVYAREPGANAWTPAEDEGLQARLDARELPPMSDRGSGSLLIEAHTVRYERGEPASGIALGSLDDGSRCVAVSVGDTATLDALLTRDCVGLQATVNHRDGLNHFRL